MGRVMLCTWCMAILGVLFLPPTLFAQTVDSVRPLPAIELDAQVRIRELRYESVGSVSVRLFGLPTIDSQTITRRINLPEHPEPGVTYRNVELTYHLECTLPELEEILRSDTTLALPKRTRKQK